MKKIERKIQSFALVAAVLLLSTMGLLAQVTLRASAVSALQSRADDIASADLRSDYKETRMQLSDLEDQEASNDVQVTDDQALQDQISKVELDIQLRDNRQGRQDLTELQKQIQDSSERYVSVLQSRSLQNQAVTQHSLQVPILIYHYTPSDFEQQLQYLADHHYTTITLDQLAVGFHGGEMPAKPVVITFDDGFSDQTKAFAILRRFDMKATFYIITGGQASQYCIGAGRRYGQPKACGDSYLNWDQVREMDRSGLITIASHTVDHLDLAKQSADVQRFQIFEGKKELEDQLGHPVRHFAYPYGTYNSNTVELVREAGFATAVTTTPGTIQTAEGVLTLHRIRSTLKLP